VKVNKISLKQMGGQAQNQTVDPAIQQITTYISNSINAGEDPIAVLAGLIQQQVDQNIIGQAFMVAGYQEEDVIALFEEFQKQSQPPAAASEQQQTTDPQEIARNQAMEASAIEEGAQQEQQLMAQQEAMSQQLTAKSGIEIKSKNEGKFTAWAEARGLSVPDAYNKVMNNTSGYSPSVVKMANFAKNAAAWNKKEGGEFTSHMMYKGDKSQKAESYQQHLKLKELGYTHENKAQNGKETTAAQDFFNKTGIVKKEDKLTIAPNYVNPIAFESNDNFNIGQVATTLQGGFNTMLSGEDKNNDGIKDGSFRDWQRKGAIQKEKKGDYYNYEIKTDPNDPNKYAYDNLDLYNASKPFNKGGLRDLQTFTNDVNENSRVNFNPETGNYDAMISSREINKDLYGENNAFAGENLNYFNNVDADTRELILGTQNYQDGVTLGINPEGNAASYINKESNPYYYDTMMGRNKVGVNTTMTETPNSMIPTNSNGQPQQGMFASSGPRVENDDFNTWYKKNMSSNLGKSKDEMEQLYNSTINNEFKYGGNLSKAQTGGNILYVDHNDPAGRAGYKAYQDSLSLYNRGEEKLKYWRNNPNATNSELNIMVDRIDESFPVSSSSSAFGSNMIDAIDMQPIGSGSDLRNVPLYKKPVEPVEYKPNLDTDLSAWLKTQKAATSYTDRKKLYEQATGKTDYKGTAEQNVGLLKLLKQEGLDYKIKDQEGGNARTSPEAWKSIVGVGTSPDDPGYRGVGNADGNHERYIPTAEELLWLRNKVIETPTPIINNLEETTPIVLPVNSLNQQKDSVVINTPTKTNNNTSNEVSQNQVVDNTILANIQPTSNEGEGTSWYWAYGSEWITDDNVPGGGYNKRIKTKIPIEASAPQYQVGGSIPAATNSNVSSFSKWMQDNNLPKAQFNLPDSFYGKLPYYTNTYTDAQQQGMSDYFTDMGQTNYIDDTQVVADAQLQNKQPELGITPQQQEIENLFIPQQGTQTFPTFEQPSVKRTNRFEGSIDRAMDNRGVKAFGDASEFAVNAATVANNWFEDKAINDARVDNRNKLVADNIYGVNENPFMKRGAWDINTGTFGSEGQRTVQTNMGIARRGAEINNQIINVDSTLLAKLIAAGADIEIL
jgi:hypothetical protein